MLGIWPLKILKQFKLHYLSNNQYYKMIKFGCTTVEVLHCTYLHLLLHVHYLLVEGVLILRCPNGGLYRSMSCSRKMTLKVVNKTKYGIVFSQVLFWY
jgi:hypothetical protein